MAKLSEFARGREEELSADRYRALREAVGRLQAEERRRDPEITRRDDLDSLADGEGEGVAADGEGEGAAADGEGEGAAADGEGEGEGVPVPAQDSGSMTETPPNLRPPTPSPQPSQSEREGQGEGEADDGEGEAVALEDMIGPGGTQQPPGQPQADSDDDADGLGGSAMTKCSRPATISVILRIVWLQRDAVYLKYATGLELEGKPKFLAILVNPVGHANRDVSLPKFRQDLYDQLWPFGFEPAFEPSSGLVLDRSGDADGTFCHHTCRDKFSAGLQCSVRCNPPVTIRAHIAGRMGAKVLNATNPKWTGERRARFQALNGKLQLQRFERGELPHADCERRLKERPDLIVLFICCSSVPPSRHARIDKGFASLSRCGRRNPPLASGTHFTTWL